MARFASSFETYTALTSVALSFNSVPTFATGAAAGYMGALVANATTGSIKLRRLTLGCRVSSGGIVPTSQQVTVAIFRQTTRASGGITTITGANNLDPTTVTPSAVGIDALTAPASVTTAPVLTAANPNPLYRVTFNTQNTVDVPFENPEELICPAGSAFALVSIGTSNTLPASHLLTVHLEWEE